MSDNQFPTKTSIGEGAESVHVDFHSTNTGLYSGNVIIEYNTDQKVVKPVIKVNEKTTVEEINHAVEMAIYALGESTKALAANDFIIPEPTKIAMENQIENVRENETSSVDVGEGVGVYKDNDEILNNKQIGVDHT